MSWGGGESITLNVDAVGKEGGISRGVCVLHNIKSKGIVGLSLSCSSIMRR